MFVPGRSRARTIASCILVIIAMCAAACSGGDDDADDADGGAPATEADGDPVLGATVPPVVPTPADPMRVLLLGDGVMFDAEPGLVAAIEGTGLADVEPRSYFGMGLTRPEWLDFRTAWPALVAEVRPDLVIVLVGPWDVRDVPSDLSPVDAPTAPLISPLDPMWQTFYGNLLDQAVEILTVDGAQVWWLPMLPEPGEDRGARALAQAAAVVALPGRHTDVLAPDVHAAFLDGSGSFVAGPTAPDGTFTPWRKPDGQHLCPAGVVHLVEVLARPLGSRYGLTLPPGWESGPWSADGRYTGEPDNSCAGPFPTDPAAATTTAPATTAAPA
jgi:hypothetical protein